MVERVDTVRGAEGCRNRDLATSSRRRAFESAGVEFIDENGGDLSAKAATSSEGAGIGRVEFIYKTEAVPGCGYGSGRPSETYPDPQCRLSQAAPISLPLDVHVTDCHKRPGILPLAD